MTCSGCSVSLSEHEVHWRTFLAELKDRGLHGMQLIVSDAHEGLAAARRAVFPSVPWQRCQFHLQQNAGAYVPTQVERGPVAAELRAIFNAPDRGEAERLLERFIERHAEKAPQTGPVGRAGDPGGSDRLRLSGDPPPPTAHQQSDRAAEQGDQTPHARRHPVPERGVLLAARDGDRDGDR